MSIFETSSWVLDDRDLDSMLLVPILMDSSVRNIPIGMLEMLLVLFMKTEYEFWKFTLTRDFYLILEEVNRV